MNIGFSSPYATMVARPQQPQQREGSIALTAAKRALADAQIRLQSSPNDTGLQRLVQQAQQELTTAEQAANKAAGVPRNPSRNA